MNSDPLIRRVQATGDPFSIGRALGAAAADDIRDRVFVTEEFRALRDTWRASTYLQALERAARFHYPQYVREIEGIADGAEQEFETMFLWNCRGDLRLPDNVSPDVLLASASGCTSVMVPASDDAPAILAHNEDGAPEFLGHCFWVSVTPDDGVAYESFMYPGMLPGHTFGANAAGVVQTINNIRVHDVKPGIPRHVITRAALGARSMDDALEVLKRGDRASGFHHNMGEAGSQRLASVEAPASGCHIREISVSIAHANHLVANQFSSLAQSITQSSEDRQRRADEMIAQGEGPETILFDREAPVYRANDDGDDYSQTLSTAVFRLFANRVEWTIHATPAARDHLSGVIAVEAGL